MTFTPSTIAGLVIAASFAAGLNVYATVLTLGILARVNWVELPPGLEVLANGWVIAASAAMFSIEFFADKIPAFDLIWNALHTFVRIPLAALLAYRATLQLSPEMQLLATVGGALIAAAAHSSKTAARTLGNAQPGTDFQYCAQHRRRRRRCRPYLDGHASSRGLPGGSPPASPSPPSSPPTGYGAPFRGHGKNSSVHARFPLSSARRRFSGRNRRQTGKRDLCCQSSCEPRTESQSRNEDDELSQENRTRGNRLHADSRRIDGRHRRAKHCPVPEWLDGPDQQHGPTDRHQLRQQSRT